ncbi:MAG: glycosyltransferase family 39 protein [Candidatus Omnitrophota bacterium]
MQSLALFFRKNAVLVLVISFFVFANLIWWQQNKFIQGPDEGEHLYKSIELYESGGYLREFLHPKAHHSSYNGPFFYSTAGIFYRLFNSSAYRVSILNILIYAVILLIGISRLERLFFNTAGILSPMFCMLIYTGGVYSRFFNPDIAVCAILVWFMYFLKKLNDTVNPKYFFMSALLILIGGYTKVMFYLYAAFPLLSYLLMAFRRGEVKKITFNLMLIAFLPVLFWFIYPVPFERIILGRQLNCQDMLQQDNLSVAYTAGGCLGNLKELVLIIVNSQFGGIMFLFFIFSLLVFIFSTGEKEDRFSIIACFLGPLLAFFISTFSSLRIKSFEDRYFMPLVITEAIIMSFALNRFFRRRIVLRFAAALFILFFFVQYLGFSFSRTWIDFFNRHTVLKGAINLSHKPTLFIAPSLPIRSNPLDGMLQILRSAQENGVPGTACFIYDFEKEPFTDLLSKRLGYYTRRNQHFIYTVCDGYLTCTAGSVSEANFIIVSRSYLKEKTEVLSPESLFYRKGCLDNPEAYQPFLEEFESFLREGRFRLYRQVGAYDHILNRKEDFFMYLKEEMLKLL